MSEQSRHLRLLVVDDDQLNLNMVRVMLTPQGHELEFASSGAEALEAVQAHPFDLVFLDLVLPDLDGREVCRHIRAWETANGRPRTPVIALTAYDLPGQALELLKAGMDDYLFKPFDVKGLTRMLKLYATGEGREKTGDSAAAESAQVSEAPVLDYEGSLRDFSNDADGYRELLKDFVATLPGRMQKLVQAQQAGDMARLGRECHSLKGVAAGLGAMRLSLLATRLGHACADGRTGSITNLLEQVRQAMQDLQTAARAALQS